MSDDTKHKILEAYKVYILEEGKSPPTVFKFMRDIDLTEGVFYDHYASFEALHSSLWVAAFEEVMSSLGGDETYEEYTVREKWLAFYFAFFERLKRERSLYIHLWPEGPDFFRSSSIKKLRNAYRSQASSWLDEAEEEGSIREGWLPQEIKEEIAWWKMAFLIQFWTKDDSNGFERTDAAIEKTIHLLFDVLSNEVGEKLVDLAKFLAPDGANPLDLVERFKGSWR